MDTSPKEYTSDSGDGFIVDNTIIPKHIARRGRTTVVWWTDGSKTHVVDQADEERKNARSRRLREEEKKARAEKRRLEQEHERQGWEGLVRMHMAEMRLKREAHRRLDEEGH